MNQSLPLKVTPCKEPFTQVSTGGFYGAAITRNGSVFVWGCLKDGRTGLAEKQAAEFVNPPTRLSYLKSHVAQVACGNWHTIILLADSTVMATGHNLYGALGLGDAVCRDQFCAIDALSHITQVAAGDGFSLFLHQNQTVLSCGHKERHGHSSHDHINRPKVIPEMEGIKYINCGFLHAGAVNCEGQLLTWGNGSFFQLGHKSKNNEKVPRKLAQPANVRFTQISCSRGEKHCHTGALDEEGHVYTWGSGYKGKLGHAEKWTHQDKADELVPRMIQAVKDIKFIKVCCGGIHTAILSEGGQVYTFGCGSNGRLGHQESDNYKYLYREGYPRVVEELKGKVVVDLSSSYYFNACIAADQN